MQKFILSLLLCAGVCAANGQVPVALQIYDPGLKMVQKDEFPLFDLEEIRARKIDTVYIIYHPGSWPEYDPVINPCTCSYNDTFSRYLFDAQGRIREARQYQGHIYTQVSVYDSTGRMIAMGSGKDGREPRITPMPGLDDDPDTTRWKEHIVTEKRGQDSIITSYQFWKFKAGMDTAVITRERYNAQQKLVESKSRTKKT